MAGSSATLLVVLSVIGYVLLRHACFRTHHRWQALEWQQNIFEATTAGLVLFAASRLALSYLAPLNFSWEHAPELTA